MDNLTAGQDDVGRVADRQLLLALEYVVQAAAVHLSVFPTHLRLNE
jgi:hypothetical protein